MFRQESGPPPPQQGLRRRVQLLQAQVRGCPAHPGGRQRHDLQRPTFLDGPGLGGERSEDPERLEGAGLPLQAAGRTLGQRGPSYSEAMARVCGAGRDEASECQRGSRAEGSQGLFRRDTSAGEGEKKD